MTAIFTDLFVYNTSPLRQSAPFYSGVGGTDQFYGPGGMTGLFERDGVTTIWS